MNKIEKMLEDKKLEIDNITIPEDLEIRLRSALDKNTVKRKPKTKWRTRVAVFLLASAILGYHIDTFAYYGKKLTGYDQIMGSTLKQLNELGKGQIIDKKYTFSNGLEVILDGVILDDNQLLTFYTIKNPVGDIDRPGLSPLIFMNGICGEHRMRGGRGITNDSKTETKWISEFEPPYFFERKLKFSFTLMQGNKSETGEISFILDRSKAMKHTLKKVINKNIQADDVSIHFESIKASPTTTYIEGKIQNIVELAIGEISGEKIRPEVLNIKLIANGSEVQEQGGGMSTNMKGISFSKNYDALPNNLKSLQLQLVSFGVFHDVKSIVELEKNKKAQEINILGKSVEINNVYESNGDTYVTITTEDSVVLSKVYLLLEDKRIELQETITDKKDKKSDGTITHTRTLHFKGTGSQLKLDVQRIKYSETLNKTIDIPVD